MSGEKDVFVLVKEELKGREIAFVERIAPYYIASAGAHLFNIVNKKEDITYEHGQINDYRLHMFFVAPSGFGKSFILNQFLEGNNSIFGSDRCPLSTAMEQRMTEAAFSGTIRGSNEDSKEIKKGLADEYKHHILGVGEFDAIQKAMSTDHSGNLDNALLEALDSGWVKKGMALDRFNYQTFFTNWTGSQATRFDLSQGLGRRYLFIMNIPNNEDIQTIKKKRREGRGITSNLERVGKIGDKVADINNRLQDLEGIAFTDNFYDYLDNYDMLHYEEPLYERLAIGYHVMKGNFDNTLIVDINDELKDMIEQSEEWRKHVRLGPHVRQVEVILEDADGELFIEELLDKMTRFGMTAGESAKVINEGVKIGKLKRETAPDLPDLIKLPDNQKL